jgi:hypothetical protein
VKRDLRFFMASRTARGSVATAIADASVSIRLHRLGCRAAALASTVIAEVAAVCAKIGGRLDMTLVSPPAYQPPETLTLPAFRAAGIARGVGGAAARQKRLIPTAVDPYFVGQH